jgi:NTP pyrophosphatase (non-canonical NTP hydrolase)
MQLDLNTLQKEVYQNKVNHHFNVTDTNFELLLMHGELNELFRGILKHDQANIQEEIADVAIYLLGLAEILHVDLGQAIVDKLRIDEQRVYEKDGSKHLKGTD